MCIRDSVNIVADIVHYCVKGIEAPYIRGQIGEELDDETGWAYVAKMCIRDRNGLPIYASNDYQGDVSIDKFLILLMQN